MLCENCGVQPVSVHLTKVVNGHMTQLHLCQACAQGSSEFPMFGDPAVLLQNLLANFVGQTELAQPETSPRCPSCGFRFSELRATGRLGCPNCYAHFQAELEPMLRRLHGTTEHRGKLPRRRGATHQRQRRIQELRSQLHQSVAREEFERAAELRDELRRLESQGGDAL